MWSIILKKKKLGRAMKINQQEENLCIQMMNEIKDTFS